MKLLIIEDDDKISQLLNDSFQNAGFDVDVALTGITAINKLESSHLYDLVILDLMLPEVDGLSILKMIRRKEKYIPVVILSARHTFEDRVEGLTGGADDYIIKPFSFPELLIRVQNLLKRIPRIDDSRFLEIDDLKVDIMKREVRRSGKKIELQTKEYDLLLLLLKHRNVVLSKTLILKEVWGYEFDPQTNVVDVLVCRLRNKIDKTEQIKLIHTIRGLGYVCRKD